VAELAQATTHTAMLQACAVSIYPRLFYLGIDNSSVARSQLGAAEPLAIMPEIVSINIKVAVRRVDSSGCSLSGRSRSRLRRVIGIDRARIRRISRLDGRLA
jgi:hypothetical protein